jgi:hypothetical protein
MYTGGNGSPSETNPSNESYSETRRDGVITDTDPVIPDLTC